MTTMTLHHLGTQECGEMRTPELVREFVAIKCSPFPRTREEAFSSLGEKQHRRLGAVVTELRARGVLD